MITLLLSGGLGNQMFQYAFARSLALNNDAGIQISRRFLTHDTLGRRYSLDKLSLPDIQFMTHGQEFIAHTKLYIMRKIHGRSFHSRKFIYLSARDYDFYEPALLTRDYDSNLIICGYFQSWKYFQEHDSALRNEFRVSKSPSLENEAKINEITSCESVCVHVRRGDYLTLQGWNVCNYDYYSQSMQYISSRIASPVFYFFSNTHDDINWLRENYKFPDYDVRYIDLDNPDYEELRLMYSCRHFIIANSSLSWWGSYLSSNPEKIICAPSKWVRGQDTESTGLYMPNWSIIRL